MNASLLLLSSALLVSADPVPIVVQGQGCTNCGSAVSGTVPGSPYFASATFGADACGSPVCGSPVCGSRGVCRFGLLDRLRSRLRGTGEGRGVVGCGMNDCGLNVARPAFVTALRSSFVASNTATAPSYCAAPALACYGCAGSTGIVYGSPATGFPAVMPAPAVMPPAAMPMPIPPAAGSTVPKTLPPADAPKGTDAKEKTKALPAPVVPLSPSELPRIPTLSGLGG